jgi:hypothetical protein
MERRVEMASFPYIYIAAAGVVILVRIFQHILKIGHHDHLIRERITKSTSDGVDEITIIFLFINLLKDSKKKKR